MKKLLSIVLALSLVLSLSLPAFAEGDENNTDTGSTGTTTQDTEITQDSANQTGSTNVTYTVDPAYTVTIPASVTIDGTNNSNTVTVSAEGVKVAKGQQVVVKLTGINVTSENANGDTEFKVKTAEGAELKYTVKDASGNTINKDGTVLTVNPASTTSEKVASDSSVLTFALDDTVKYAGEYTGTVTFTVSVESVSTDSGNSENP